MINLDDMKKKLSADLEQEAREAGRLDPDIKEASEPVKEYTPKRSGADTAETPTREDKESIIDTPIHFDNLTPENIDEYIKTCPTDDKGNRIIPDQIFEEYRKYLPDKCINASGTWRSSGNGGKLIILGTDPERDKDIHRAGANASNATQAQRRTLAEDLKIALSRKATRQTLAELNLSDGATNQDAITAAAILQATEGNVKALQYIRDTIGEQPTAKQDLNLTMTDEDKRLLEKVEARLNS